MYKAQADEIMGSHDGVRKVKIQREYRSSAVISSVLFVPWFIFYVSPYFINIMLCNKTIEDK